MVLKRCCSLFLALATGLVGNAFSDSAPTYLREGCYTTGNMSLHWPIAFKTIPGQMRVVCKMNSGSGWFDCPRSKQIRYTISRLVDQQFTGYSVDFHTQFSAVYYPAQGLIKVEGSPYFLGVYAYSPVCPF